MGTVTNVVIEKTTGRISVILVDSEHVGQDARYTSVYNSINKNAIPMHKTQATFPIQKKHHFKQLGLSFH